VLGLFYEKLEKVPFYFHLKKENPTPFGEASHYAATEAALKEALHELITIHHISPSESGQLHTLITHLAKDSNYPLFAHQRIAPLNKAFEAYWQKIQNKDFRETRHFDSCLFQNFD